MRYASVSSGIEAPSLAWEPLGWEPVFFSEIAPFPCAVLTRHWPRVPNLGDMTKITGSDWRGKVNVLVGGTPCQAFSVAGLREGLNDARGNLTLVFAHLANDMHPDFVAWENVPGVLSDKTNAFGCLLGALAGEDAPLVPPGKKWTNAGYVLGPERAIAWRVLDAQYFGLAQRRRRVFLVACPRNGADPREILFESEGVRRDFAPSREAREEVAGSLAARTRSGGGLGTDFDCGGGLVAACLNGVSSYNSEIPTLRGAGGDCAGGSEALLAFGGNNCSGPIDVATARGSSSSPHGRLDFESETFVVGTLACNSGPGSHDAGNFSCNQGVDAGHIIPVAFPANLSGTQCASAEDICPSIGAANPTAVCALVFDTTQVTSPANYSSPKPGDPCHPLAPGAHPPAIATLAIRGRGGESVLELRHDGLANAVLTPNGGRCGIGCGAIQRGVQVRRLTPRECERLQGMPDDYTLIPIAKARKIKADYYAYLKQNYPWLSEEEACRLAADGPRYKAIGNSMAVTCMQWLGRRIALVAARTKEALCA